MSGETMFFVIDMEEITKAQYYEARKDERKLVFNKPFGFVWSVGPDRIAYLTSGGKFYRGALQPKQTYRDMEDFDYQGVEIRCPQGVFKRKPSMANEKAPLPVKPTAA